MRLAAIDIGSNAARLLIVEVKKHGKRPEFTELNLIRIPLRLGFDVFEHGSISRERREMMMHMMRAFSALLKLYKVDAVHAYASSAMRNASNSNDIIRDIKKNTGIGIEIISGSREAELLYQSHAAEKINKNETYLYVNVGGGSTELNLFVHGKPKKELSFEIGTIRVLKNSVPQARWDELKRELKSIAKKFPPTAIIGSGGNINKVFSLSKLKDGEPLSLVTLQSYHRKLKRLSPGERVRQYGLKIDRADVIVPALSIYQSIMQWVDVETMFVPKIGLVDGIIYDLYLDARSQSVL